MEVDKTSVVSRVIDGDTFEISTGERVRLADIDAPESGQAGYSQARSVLSSLVLGKTVYLDIDDVYRTDRYGRLVCVVYVRWDSTSYKNVNKALLIEGVAVIMNYNNEFSPSSWTLYTTVMSDSGDPSQQPDASSDSLSDFLKNLPDIPPDFLSSYRDEPEGVPLEYIAIIVFVIVALTLVTLIIRQDKMAKTGKEAPPTVVRSLYC